MKSQLRHLLTLVCILTLCGGLTVPAEAINVEKTQRRASDYLAYYAVYAVAKSDGEILIEWDVQATERMNLVGASCIIVQEKVGSKWIGVATYFGSVSNGMLSDNASIHVNSISYYGTHGKEYRALATVYAADDTGDDSRTIITNSVIAK